MENKAGGRTNEAVLIAALLIVAAATPFLLHGAGMALVPAAAALAFALGKLSRKEETPGEPAAPSPEPGFCGELLGHAAVPAFALNSRHEVIVWNRALEELSGLAASEVVGTNRHWSCCYKEERPTLADLVLEGKDAGQHLYHSWRRSSRIPGALQGEGWLTNIRGEEGFYLLSAAPIRDAAGNVVASIETVEDFTDWKNAEDQLRKLSWAVEQSPTIVLITDTEGSIEYVNRKFEEVTGYSREEVLGQNLRLLKSGLMSDQVYAELWETVTSGEEWRGELQNKKKDGELYWEAATVSPIKDEKGRVSNFVALMEDVTESRALAMALNHAQKMEALGTLTGGVAHDFNNILTAIIGYANLIQMKLPEGDPSIPFVEKVVSAAEKATSLTRGLLTYSRSHTINPAPVDLNRLVGRVTKLIDRVIGDGVSLTTQLDTRPLTIFADSGQLEQILMNLARNGAEAMSGSGALTITTGEAVLDDAFLKRCGFGVPGTYALLRVTDNGPGLDEKTRERIFEPFFTTHGAGPGLGLSIVYGIVKQHKGYIEVESTPGVGSSFSVYFPLLNTTPL